MPREQCLEFELALPESRQPLPGLLLPSGVLKQVRAGLFAFKQRCLPCISASGTGSYARGDVGHKVRYRHLDFPPEDGKSRLLRPLCCQAFIRVGTMKNITKTILTTITVSFALLFLAACGGDEPGSASEAAVQAAAEMGKAADSDEVKNAQQEAEAAAEEAKKQAGAETN